MDRSPPTTFPVGDMYACDDPETLEHTDPMEAIEAFVEKHNSYRCDVAKVILDIGSVELSAYVREEVSDGWITRAVERLEEELREMFGEEYGPPDDAPDDDDAFIQMHSIMKTAVRTYADAVTVWACEKSGTVTLDATEVEALMRVHRPDWFDKP